MRFLAYHLLGDTPNVVVDGPPTQSTVLTLSHWPGSTTPPELARDLSAEIAFAYLDAVEADRMEPAPAEVVSNNHFDEDGVVSVAVLVDPAAARARRERYVDVARAGDFGDWHDRDSARVALAVSALADPDLSPLDPSIFELGWAERTGALYDEIVPRLPGLCDHPERHTELWAAGDASLQRTLDDLAAGRVTVAEDAGADLAVVTVAPGTAAPDPLALHHVTGRLAVLTVSGRHYRLRHRYETWVVLACRPSHERTDLTPLARRLEAEESGGVSWEAGPVNGIMPSLAPAGGVESTVAAERVVELVTEHLRAAPMRPLAGS